MKNPITTREQKLLTSISKAVGKAMKTQGFNYNDVAARAHVDPITVSRFVQKATGLNLTTAVRICTAVGLTPSALLAAQGV